MTEEVIPKRKTRPKKVVKTDLQLAQDELDALNAQLSGKPTNITTEGLVQEQAKLSARIKELADG